MSVSNILANRERLFGRVTLGLSVVGLVCVAAALFAASPDSPSIIRNVAWSTASGAYGSGHVNVYAGMDAVVQDTTVGSRTVTKVVPWAQEDCADGSKCEECAASTSNTKLALVSAMITMALSAYMQFARASRDDDNHRQAAVLTGLSSAASLLYACMQFAASCYGSVPANVNGVVLALEPSFGTGWYLVVLGLVSKCLVTAAHVLTPVLRFSDREVLATNLLNEAHTLQSIRPVGARKFAPSSVPAVRARPVYAETEAEEPPAPPAPTMDGRYTSVVGENFDVKKMPGVLPPVGFFDPLGLSNDATEERIRYFREAELKHGRVAMLAAVGFLVQESFHPFFGGEIDTPSYLSFQQTPLQKFWQPVVGALSALETYSISKFKTPGVAPWQIQDSYEPGSIGFDPLGMKPGMNDVEYRDRLNKELQNGRLAMLGIAGMVAQELVNGQKIGSSSASAAELPSTSEIAALAHGINVPDLAREVAEMLNATSHV